MLGKHVWISQQPVLLSTALFLFYEAELSSGHSGGKVFMVVCQLQDSVTARAVVFIF